MPVSGDWKGGGIRQNIEMTGKALFGQTIRKSPKAALLVLPKPPTLAEIVDRGRQGFRCVFLLRGRTRDFLCSLRKNCGVCRELLSRERTYPVVNTVADSCGCLLAGNCVSPCRQCGQATLLFLPPHNNASEKPQRSRRRHL